MVSGIALRREIITVLRLAAFNEKFTTWQRQCKALGIIFDFDCLTETMSASKIAKWCACCSSLTLKKSA
jgi:hypothetical protein